MAAILPEARDVLLFRAKNAAAIAAMDVAYKAKDAQIEAAARIGASVVELHTGAYCDHDTEGRTAERDAELSGLAEGARLAASLGLEVHAGHGLTFDTVGPIAALPQIAELNIGHFLIAESVFTGLGPAIREMRRHMEEARG